MAQNNQSPKTTYSPLLTPYCLLPTAVFLLVLTLYLFTLAPGVVGGDAGEHQFVAPLLAIPHATGYPLYVLAGKLWTLLVPIGPMAWRMNLFSAVGGAAAAALTTLIVFRLTKGEISHTKYLPRWSGALVAGLILSFGLTLWQWSIIAGVRSINVLFFALLTLLALVWQQQRQRGNTQAAERTLRWLTLTIGLSLAHHRTTIFYLPSLLGWVWWHDRRLVRQPKRLLILFLLAIAPLTLYAFIYLRGINQPPYTHEYITDLKSFWFLVGASDSSGLFLTLDPAFLPARLAFIWRDILAQLSMPGVILASFGALCLAWRQTKQLLFQGLLALLLLLFVLDFEVVNLNEAPTWYLMPAYFIFAVWVGVGVNGVSRIACRVSRDTGHGLRFARRPRFTEWLIALLFTAIFTYTLAWPNWQKIYAVSVAPLDEWRQLLRGTQAERLVENSMPYVKPGSLILGDWEQYTPFMYYQLINGWRPDVEPRLPLNRWPQQVAGARAKGQEVYFARKTTDLIGTPYLSMVGPLIYLGTAPNFDLPAGIMPLQANFENQLELMGYEAKVMAQHTPGGAKAGPIIQLLFYWRIPQKVAWDYALSLRLLDAAGQEIYKRDATHPVLSSYPTTLWTPGEVVGDFYELPFPPGTGPLTLHLLPYRTEGPDRWHNLKLVGAEPPQEGILLGPFEER
ncbi:MAG: DUF2723 domain-containing protein [Anaerolineae bacterium]|nr:DUF2723 domain-containing protein [Anaerolineae bacterium]